MVKRLLLVLMAAGILDFSQNVVEVQAEESTTSYVAAGSSEIEMKKVVHFYVSMVQTFIESNGRLIPIEGIYDDKLWSKITTK